MSFSVIFGILTVFGPGLTPFLGYAGSFCGYFVSCQGDFTTILGVILGSFWDQFDVILGSFRGQFVIILELVWCICFSRFFGNFEVTLEFSFGGFYGPL